MSWIKGKATNKALFIGHFPVKDNQIPILTGATGPPNVLRENVIACIGVEACDIGIVYNIIIAISGSEGEFSLVGKTIDILAFSFESANVIICFDALSICSPESDVLLSHYFLERICGKERGDFAVKVLVCSVSIERIARKGFKSTVTIDCRCILSCLYIVLEVNECCFNCLLQSSLCIFSKSALRFCLEEEKFVITQEMNRCHFCKEE